MDNAIGSPSPAQTTNWQRPLLRLSAGTGGAGAASTGRAAGARATRARPAAFDPRACLNGFHPARKTQCRRRLIHVLQVLLQNRQLLLCELLHLVVLRRLRASAELRHVPRVLRLQVGHVVLVELV